MTGKNVMWFATLVHNLRQVSGCAGIYVLRRADCDIVDVVDIETRERVSCDELDATRIAQMLFRDRA